MTDGQYTSADTTWCRLALTCAKSKRVLPQPLPERVTLTLHKSHKSLRVTSLNVLDIAADSHSNGMVGESARLRKRLRRRGRKRRALEWHEQRRDFLACQRRRSTLGIRRGPTPGHIVMPTLTLGNSRLTFHLRKETGALYAEH